MLRELHISNFAVIADARIELTGGLNCFTGATGAGKSLVIGAVEVLLGQRSASEMLRSGVDEGRVSGVFQVDDAEMLNAIEAVSDVPVAGDGGELLITRRLYASGRSSVSLNGHPITLSMLKIVAEHLIDVHGQHDHQFLLKPANQLDVLDQFGKLQPLRETYRAAYGALTDAQNRLAELSADRNLRQQQLALYRFQAGEIDAAELQAGEFEELSARASVLRNVERLKREASTTHAALYEVEGSVLERVKMMSCVIAELSSLDPTLQSVAAGLKDAMIQLEESAFDLSRYLDRLDLDPKELAEVDDRLNVLQRLMSKYGQTPDAVLTYREEIGQSMAVLERAGDDLSSLQSQLAPLQAKAQAIAIQLSEKRQAVAKRLGPSIERSLAELGMEKAKFTVDFSPIELSVSGTDGVEYLAQTNPGLSIQPLRKIASGGELSRIMLALKGILAQSDRVSVLVFDEIDANVGGRLGAIIGRKLRELASHHQVLCITHLPQIASYADRHFTVRKVQSGSSTATTVRATEGAERIEELAEMIGGHLITDTTRAQAVELLDAGKAGFKPAAKKSRRTA